MPERVGTVASTVGGTFSVVTQDVLRHVADDANIVGVILKG